MKFSRKLNILWSISGISGFAALATACNNPVEKKPETKDPLQAEKEQIEHLWDNTITIVNEYINDGFGPANEGDEIPQIQKDFLALLSARFNALKEQDPLTKGLQDVKFKIATDYDKPAYYSKLENDNKDKDVFIANYSTYFQNFFDANRQFKRNLDVNLIAQAATLKFKWQASDNDYYVDGSATDKLRITANKNNEVWVKDTGYDFPDWKIAESKGKVHFDGSKYTTFYSDNELTYVYHGAILIAGNLQKRQQIIRDWEAKDWDKFVAHGISYKEKESSGSYKYQVALLARHFNKTVEFVNEYLQSSNANVVATKSPRDQLGRAATTITPHIGFDYEGAYNWTRYKEGRVRYEPTGYISQRPYDDPENVVIRTLTLTNPAAYDVALGRKGLSKKQSELIGKALQSLSLQENTYGIYTGYNKFMPITMDLLEKFSKLQIQAETTQNLVNDIPAISTSGQ
ncbi:ABC transporter thiamine pyrophosphate-binding lipoprotein p37/Cypl [Mycoplasma simbae]|uniref:ABC transporter thiamine pyrophosphate-binding lipoprotein p37/Cypl n=1 Tax=Mycoplasma simbae TaxID=36744 RepID=UPI0004980C2D|nr:hypothetical protein [Mycoplasma simbae]